MLSNSSNPCQKSQEHTSANLSNTITKTHLTSLTKCCSTILRKGSQHRRPWTINIFRRFMIQTVSSFLKVQSILSSSRIKIWPLRKLSWWSLSKCWYLVVLSVFSEVNYYRKCYKEKELDKKALVKKWRTYELTRPMKVHKNWLILN